MSAVRLAQYWVDRSHTMLAVGVVDESGAHAYTLSNTPSTYALAWEAVTRGMPLAHLVKARARTSTVSLEALEHDGRLAWPIMHPDPAHLLVSGTGLTHLGGAETRDALNRARSTGAETDSARMFRWGVEGGKPLDGPGVQPEWFYKGDGRTLAPPGAPLPSPDFALDGGEEPELAVIYVVGPDGVPWRVGTAMGNEFSDHAMERQNYLYLAHSKLRPCSCGPELRLGPPPADVRGTSRIVRNGQVVWERPFLTGERHMSHSLANLERHHFKYAAFRRPGDVHVHFLGTATLSVADGVTTQPGDRFEIEAEGFGRPLCNVLAAVDGGYPGVRDL